MKVERGSVGLTGQGGYQPPKQESLTKEERMFVEGLKKLTNKTGLAIAGCGCCGSPFLLKAESGHYSFRKKRGIVEELGWEQE